LKPETKEKKEVYKKMAPQGRKKGRKNNERVGKGPGIPHKRDPWGGFLNGNEDLIWGVRKGGR